MDFLESSFLFQIDSFNSVLSSSFLVLSFFLLFFTFFYQLKLVNFNHLQL